MVVRCLVIALLAALACLAPVAPAAEAACPAPAAKAKSKAKKAKKTRKAKKKHKRAKKARAACSTPARAPKPAPTRTPSPTAAGPSPALAPPSLTREAQATDALLSRRPFATGSFWNAPLADDAPLDARSATYVAALQRQLTQWAPYVNTTRYSTPVYEVPADQPTVRVTLDQRNPALSAALAAVPIPENAQPAVGTDGQLVVWQRSTDTLWELWRAVRRDDGWHATYGGRITGVSRNPGYFDTEPQWGATATSLPLLGGLIRLDELRAGRIDHAVAIGLPELRAGVYSWPAQRTDGTIDSPDAIPEGARFRIDPAVDLDRLPMAPIVRQLARAVQRYGMVVRDRAGAVAFVAEDPTPTGTNPFLGPTGFFGGGYISQLLAAFPWSHLQVLRTDLRSQG